MRCPLGGGKNENTFNDIKMRFIRSKCVFRACKLFYPCFCYLLFYRTFERCKKMKMILFLIGLLLLGGLYLYFVETWRIGCAIFWAIIPAYCLAGVAILEE